MPAVSLLIYPRPLADPTLHRSRVSTQLDQDDAQGNIPSARGYAVADASHALQQAVSGFLWSTSYVGGRRRARLSRSGQLQL